MINIYKLKSIGYLFLLLCFLFWIYYFSIGWEKDMKNIQHKICVNEVNNEYFGIVDSTYIGGKSNIFFINKENTHFFLKNNSVSNLSIGDSIVKNKGESRYIIYKKSISNDSILILDFECK